MATAKISKRSYTAAAAPGATPNGRTLMGACEQVHQRSLRMTLSGTASHATNNNDASTCHVLRRCRGSRHDRGAWAQQLSSRGLAVMTIGSDAEFLRLVFDPLHESHRGRGDTMRSISFVSEALNEANAAADWRRARL